MAVTTGRAGLVHQRASDAVTTSHGAMDPATFYETALSTSHTNVERDERLLQRIEIVRVLLALTAVALFLIRDDLPGAAGLLGSIAAVVAFIVAVRRHRIVKTSLLLNRRLVLAARAGQARLTRSWRNLPAMRQVEVAAGWPTWTANDIDVVGDYALARLLDVSSLGGLQRLTEWMLGAVPPVEIIVARQQSVQQLRGRPALLLAGSADTRFAGPDSRASLPDSFVRWCNTPSSGSRALRFLSLLPPLFLVVVAALLAFRQFALANGLAYLFAFVNVSAALWVQRAQRIEFEEFERALAFLRSTQRLLETTEGTEPVAGRFGEIQAAMKHEGVLSVVRRLVQLLDWASVRHSPMLHWVLNAVFGFDIIVARQLETWRTSHAAKLPLWLEQMSEIGALFSLGTLAFEHPGWPMPDVHDDPEGVRLSATGLAHPLLVPSTAVPNDVLLQRSGDVIVVSGANMAGKSTFLRAIGLNVLLAQAGSVVAARAFQLHRCRLRTSVRVEDDLGSGVSLFLAEVTRVKQVIDEARDNSRAPVLFLLDEVLHGTNAADRRAASQRVLAQLRETEASGVIATHDPAIGILEDANANPVTMHETSGAPRQIHFACQVVHEPETGKIQLVFDYRARPGPARESNALAILDLLGLQGED